MSFASYFTAGIFARLYAKAYAPALNIISKKARILSLKRDLLEDNWALPLVIITSIAFIIKANALAAAFDVI